MKNYIFDFGNVIAEFYPEKLTEPYIADEKMRKEISDIVFDRCYWNKLDDGTITDDEVKEGIRSRVPENMASLSCDVYDNWINNLTPVKNMEKLIYDIHKDGHKLFLISNISIGFHEGYSKVKWIKDIFDCFDGLVMSAVVGKSKPNADIFNYLLETYNLKAEECIFIDDSEKNVNGAKAVGIEGYLFDGDAEKLRNYIYNR